MDFPVFPEFHCGEDSCGSKMRVQSLGNIELEICVQLEEASGDPSQRQLEVLDRFASRSPVSLAKEIATAALDYYRRIDEEVGLEDEGVLIDESQIERHFEFLDVTIPKHDGCVTEFVMLGLNCDWEEEHGMHILLVDGMVAYCGSCTTLFFGSGWKEVISADDEQSRSSRLGDLLSRLPS